MVHFSDAFGHGEDPFGVVRLGHYHPGSRVGDLVAEELTLVRRVDRDDHSPDSLHRKKDEHGVDVVVQHRDDPVPGLHPERLEAALQGGRDRILVPRRPAWLMTRHLPSRIAS